MRPFISWRSSVALASIALGAISSATTMTLASDPVVSAVRHGNCSKAVSELKAEIGSKKGPTALFVGGRMLDEGICVEQDRATATKFYAESMEMGDPNAALEYAAKIGLGEGEPQNYLRAGDICHTAGLDPRGRLSFYSLGYACTVRGMVGRMLRETLPKGAFQIPTSPAVVEFSPGNSQMHIVSMPKAERAEAHTGALMGAPVVNAQEVIEKAWSEALVAVPPPEAASLGSGSVEMTIDVDMTLEVGRNVPRNPQDAGQLLRGDVLLNTPMGNH
jgi:TPR repeat protein